MSNNYDGPILLDDGLGTPALPGSYFGFGRAAGGTESTGPRILAGPGDPAGVLIAPAGSLWLRSDTGQLYISAGAGAWAGGGAGPFPLAANLAVGNTTGGTSIEVSAGDDIFQNQNPPPVTPAGQGSFFVGDGTGGTIAGEPYYRAPAAGALSQLNAAAATPALSAVLGAGNTTGGTSLVLSVGDFFLQNQNGLPATPAGQGCFFVGDGTGGTTAGQPYYRSPASGTVYPLNQIARTVWLAGTDYANNNGRYRTRDIGGTGSHRFTFSVPDDFVSLTGLYLHAITPAGGASATANIDLFSDYGKLGEGAQANSESNTTATYNLSALNTHVRINVATVFTGIEAGDRCGLFVDHNAIGGTISYLGLRMSYNSLTL